VIDQNDLEIAMADVELDLGWISPRTTSGKIRREEARGGSLRIGKAT
jgi:hypothetical protein